MKDHSFYIFSTHLQKREVTHAHCALPPVSDTARFCVGLGNEHNSPSLYVRYYVMEMATSDRARRCQS